MARYERDFHDYTAGLQLNMRQHPEGGDVLEPCVAKWSNDQARAQRDLVVLVHGFNNNRCDAQEAYSGFRGRQKGLIDQQYGQQLDDMLGDAFWPGDADFAGPLDTVDFLVYVTTIKTAKETAEQLSVYLRGRQDVLNLNFVGHSMGCRVILETIRLLKEAPDFQTPIRKVCLLAAAVPTSAVIPKGALAEAFQAPDQVLVLHSTSDIVLSVAFPVGQTLAGDGFFPSAIGRHGDVPRNPGRVDIQSVDGAAHSDYWGWTKTDQSAVAATLISQFLRVGTRERDLPESAVAERSGPARRDDSARRQVGG